MGGIFDSFRGDRRVRIETKPVRHGRYVWIAYDASSGTWVCTGPLVFTSPEQAERHANDYLKIQGS